MNPEQFELVVLEAPIRKEKTWVYPWIGVLFGIVARNASPSLRRTRRSSLKKGVVLEKTPGGK